MKKIILNQCLFPALAVLALVVTTSSTQAQFPQGDYVNNFATGGNVTPFSGSGSVASWIYWYNTPGGNLNMTNDVTMPDPLGGPGAGSLLVDNPFGSDGTQNLFFGTFGNGGGYDFSVKANLLNFDTVSFDVYVNPTNQVAPPDANGNWGTLNVGVITSGYGYEGFANGHLTIPGTASNGWVHLSCPIDKTLAGIDTIPGICFNYNSYGGYPKTNLVFWVGNLVMHYSGVPPPPPTNSPLAKTTRGFNVIYNTPGQYDRHEARLLANTGRSWVGHATVANPVIYTFTINSFPPIADAGPSGCEAYLFLIPNPAGQEGAPDYNEANAAILSVQESQTNATLTFQYKVNNPNGNGMIYGQGIYTNPPGSWDGVTVPYYESGNLGFVTVTNTSPAGAAVGTWTAKFTSDTNLTLIGPDGTSKDLVIPSYNIGYFAESSVFDIYLGGQPNQVSVLNDAVVYSSFAISNTVTPFYDNFLADANLDPTIWTTAQSSGPTGKFVVPATAKYLTSWTTPAGGYSLQAGASLTNIASWTALTVYPSFNLNGKIGQLIDNSELPAGPTAFFNLIKRNFAQLQVLLPGQTNAPGTALGYVGTPTPISLAAQGLTPTTVTVYAVDATFHIINGISDTIHLTTSDSGAFLPPDQAMVNGVASFSGSNGVLFGTTGSQTVTAQDLTSITVTNSATSASVTINP